MAFGRHWEWRGFGHVGGDLREALESLPAKFPTAQLITDEYLWAPRCRTNVKLRLGDLKLKRLLREDRGLELWLEDSGENYPFPLGAEPLLALYEALGLQSAQVPGLPLEREELLALLDRQSSEVRVVAVRKSRRQFLFSVSGSPGDDTVADQAADAEAQVTVELAEIHAPEKILSVALEHETFEAVARARDALGLESGLRPLNYFQALGIWAEGGRVLEAEKGSRDQGIEGPREE